MISDEVFQRAVLSAVAASSVEVVAEALLLSRSTIRRYMEGTSTPMQGMRASMLAVLSKIEQST